MIEFEIGGNHYQAGKLDAFKQFHVARRLLPVMSSMKAALDSETVASLVAGTGKVDMDKLLDPLADAVSSLKDEDCNYVLNTCLGVTSRQSGAGWQKVMASPGRLQFDDIDLGTMLAITMNVLQGNIGGFFPAGMQTLPAASPQ